MFCIQTGKCLQSLASLLSWFCRRSLDVPIKTCVNKTHQISINFGKISQKKGQELSPAQLTLPPFAISSTDFKSFWCCNQGPSYYWDYSHKYVPQTFSQDPNITWSSLFRSTHPWLLYEKTKPTIIQLFFIFIHNGAGMSCLYHMVYLNPFVEHWTNFPTISHWIFHPTRYLFEFFLSFNVFALR